MSKNTTEVFLSERKYHRFMNGEAVWVSLEKTRTYNRRMVVHNTWIEVRLDKHNVALLRQHTGIVQL